MRFFWLLLTLGGIGVAFVAKTPGLLGLALAVSFIAGICAVFTFAAARIDSNSRPESALLTPDVLAAIRARSAQQQSGQASRPPGTAPAANPPRRLPPGSPAS
ncbi:hypothetical protein DFR29_102135 [Tahibacter aquaticus]|uniref:Uncharacterized protein n=1 Tax=Tahibacter aquaticus TaxID=520092 RepID=A0A4R6Z6U4_9GAMM|nr:hypothetical protein [Tahibacter aquaticus]TDR47475.1 hypothetical protein DFR29_102135 [Tahibacter aquaticus]